MYYFSVKLLHGVFLINLDPCDKCAINSICKSQFDGSIKCVCPPGYNGTNCNNYIGTCIPNPCMNGGNCEEISNDYICQCTSGYVGKNCSYEGFVYVFVTFPATVDRIVIVS